MVWQYILHTALLCFALDGFFLLKKHETIVGFTHHAMLCFISLWARLIGMLELNSCSFGDSLVVVSNMDIETELKCGSV